MVAGLLVAPVLIVVCANKGSYLARYGEPDKTATGLGDSDERWPVPYWMIDTAFVVQQFLLLCAARGLGTLFFGPFGKTKDLHQVLQVANDVDIIGTIALGWPTVEQHRGRSAGRAHRSTDEFLHWGQWGATRP